MAIIIRATGLIFLAVYPACLSAQTALSPGQGIDWPLDRTADSAPNPTIQGRPNQSQANHQVNHFEPNRFEPTAAAARRLQPGQSQSCQAQSATHYAAASPAGGSDRNGQPARSQNPAAAAVALCPPRDQPLRPLGLTGQTNAAQQGNRSGGPPSAATVIGALAVVLGIFFLVAWGMRRVAPPGLTALPSEAFQVLGRAPLAMRQQAYLLRCGNKLLLVSVTATGSETLTEITDPVEVDRLAGLCHQAQPNSASAAFRQILTQVTDDEPTAHHI
jgi:flagellar biogenesis protein FliO